MISFEQPKTVSSAKKVEDIEIFDLNGEKLSFEWEPARISVITRKQAETFFGAKKTCQQPNLATKREKHSLE